MLNKKLQEEQRQIWLLFLASLNAMCGLALLQIINQLATQCSMFAVSKQAWRSTDWSWICADMSHWKCKTLGELLTHTLLCIPFITNYKIMYEFCQAGRVVSCNIFCLCFITLMNLTDLWITDVPTDSSKHDNIIEFTTHKSGKYNLGFRSTHLMNEICYLMLASLLSCRLLSFFLQK